MDFKNEVHRSVRQISISFFSLDYDERITNLSISYEVEMKNVFCANV